MQIPTSMAKGQPGYAQHSHRFVGGRTAPVLARFRTSPAARKKFFCYLILAGFMYSFAGAAAGNPTNSGWFTRVWRTDDGLPNNQVDTVVQGPDGYLWIGTPEAFARFDGFRFTRSAFTETGGNEQGGVHVLVVSRAGGLWIAPRRGTVVELNPDLSGVSPVAAGLPGTMASAMVEDNDGAVWIAYATAVWRIKNRQARPFTTNEGVPGGSIFANGLTRDKAGNVWLAKGRRVGVFQKGRFKQLADLRAGVAHLAAGRTNGIWIGAGVRLFHCEASGRLQDLGAFQPESQRTDAVILLEDDAGGVWIGTNNNGLFRYDGSGFEKVETSHPSILSLAQDSEGNIWAGTAGGGLNRISRSGVRLESFDNGSLVTAMLSVCEDTNGVFWGVTQDGLLVSKERENGKWNQALTHVRLPEVVTCVAADRTGAVWFGTRYRTLHCWRDNRLTTWASSNGFASHTVVALLPAANGDLWVGEYGTPTAVQCLRDGELRTPALPKNPADIGRITALAEDAAGNIWAASIRGMLMRVDGDRFADEGSLTPGQKQPILSLYATADGALWIGYAGWGLGRLKDRKFTRITTGQGLDDDYISQIVADNRGWLWFGSGHGVFKVRQEELEQAMEGRAVRVRSIHYGRNEGLLSMEANSADTAPFVSPNPLRSRDGRLWLPMRTALAAVDPAILHENPELLSVLLTQVTMDGRTIASYGGIATAAAANLKTLKAPLHLPPGHRHLELAFTAISLSGPENVRFRYQLSGLDPDWIEAGPERLASYSRLAAGTYRFQIEACSADGPWKPAAAPAVLVVAPFVWQTWWFQLATAAFAILLVFALVRYLTFRRLRWKLQVLQQQRALDQERSRIAKDLHDDLGGSLTEVGLLVKMLDQHQGDPKKVEGSVQQISATVRRVNESLDEIVWAVNPRNDTLPDLIDFLGQAAVEFLRMADIQCEVDSPIQPPRHVLTPEVRHNLFLAVKEALNNVVRHAGARKVGLRVNATDQALTIIIEDDGHGFDQGLVDKWMSGSMEDRSNPAIQQSNNPLGTGADGLRNMRQRMNGIGGECRIESISTGGTRVSLFFPISTK